MATKHYYTSYVQGAQPRKFDIRRGYDFHVPYALSTVAEIRALDTTTVNTAPNGTTFSNTLKYISLEGVAFIHEPGSTALDNGVTRIISATGDRYVKSSNIRDTLNANRTYFVAASGGNNTSDGLTTGTALATFAEAVARFASIDPNGFVCKIKMMNGNHSQTGVYTVPTPLIDRSALVIEGNLANPTAVEIRRTTAGMVFFATGGANILVDGITTRNDAGGSSIFINNQSQAELRNMRYGFGGASAQVLAAGLSRIVLGNGTHQILGSANAFASADATSEVNAIGRAFTLSDTPAFATGFARATNGGLARFTACTFTGAATGPRFFGSGNGVIFTAQPDTHLPGNLAGTLATGAQYI